MKTKMFQFIYDLVLNDDSILNDGFFVRDTLANNKPLIKFMLNMLLESDLNLAVESSIRSYILNILFRVYQKHQATPATALIPVEVEKYK